MKHHAKPVTQTGYVVFGDGANVRRDLALTHERSRRRVPFSYQSLSSLVAALDAAWIMALSVASGISYHLVATDGAGDIAGYVGLGLVVSALFCMSARACDLYRPSSLQRPEFRKTLVIWVLVLLCLATVAFTLKIGHLFSRGATLLFFVGGMAGIIATRAGIARVLTRLMSSQALAGPRVIVLTDADWRTQNEIAASFRRYGYTVLRVFDVGGGDAEAEYSNQTAEHVRQVVRYARENRLSEIILAISWRKTALIDGIAKELRMLPYPAKLAADPTVDRLLTRPLLELGPAKAIELLPAPLTAAQRAVKRALDLTLAAAGLVALAPLFVLMAVAIRLDSPGPIFFMQKRIGFNGRPFRIYKFRTMTTLEDGPLIPQARRNDDRITRVGRILRRLSLDELPQLLNVVKGEMSLVGPRPHALAHDDRYAALIASYAMRQKMKPGITGLAQISGCRGETPHVGMMKRRVEFDLRYIDSWSLRLDIQILVMTVPHLFKSHQAY